jgi:ComF family protein
MTHRECNNWGVNSLFVGWEYDNIAKSILSEYKYKYAYKLSEILSKLLIDRLKQTGYIEIFTANSLIIPVPIHQSHRNKRGFNQSSLIGYRLSKELNLNFSEDLLIRKKDGTHQAQGDAKRRKSLGDVFYLNQKIINKQIIILDDVITTGTTINRVAQKLKGNSINAITLFRGRPQYQ